MDNDVVKSLTWAGLLAAIGALASIASKRLAGAIYLRVFNEDPPSDRH